MNDNETNNATNFGQSGLSKTEMAFFRPEVQLFDHL